MQGADDVIAPPEGSQRLQARIGARTERVVIERAGHCLVTEQPDAVAEATVDFLRRHR
ncbi:alpha/beta fold hydrolase [Nocardia sp. NPDC058658]|uniref:alpha/beta fold hydrolase n=1 Tax=Nocardia sp. NPDC058658 TaxID=3346580 RepID=UPI00365E8A0D